MDILHPYYEFIMGKTNSMQIHFHKEWIHYLDNLDLKYGEAIQLRVGNHLRPLLVYWGCALASKSISEIPIESATKMAICIETLHKTSIIIDDMVDDDASRNNKIAFHCQFSENEAIIFAVYLIGKAINDLNSLSLNNPELRALQVDIFSNTYCMMARGCLQELTMDQSKQYDIDAIRQVINYETTTLVKNSLLLGFLLNGPIDSKTRIMGEKIGDMIGFMFQIMNDLEPFCSKQNIICHKGSFNFDVNRSRKNIILAYIYGKCKVSEKKKLLSLGNGNDTIIFLTELYEKYDIYSVVMEDIRSIESQVYALISNLREYPLNQHCLEDFQIFFSQVMRTCRDRLDVMDQPDNE